MCTTIIQGHTTDHLPCSPPCYWSYWSRPRSSPRTADRHQHSRRPHRQSSAPRWGGSSSWGCGYGRRRPRRRWWCGRHHRDCQGEELIKVRSWGIRLIINQMMEGIFRKKIDITFRTFRFTLYLCDDNEGNQEYQFDGKHFQNETCTDSSSPIVVPY